MKNGVKSQREFWSGVMFIVVGAVFAFGATNYNMGRSERPGAGYFPMILSVFMMVLGAVVLFKALTVATPDGDRIGAFAWRPLGVIVFAIAFFGFSIERLGLFVSVPVLIVLASLAGDEFHWKGVAINALVLTVGSWAVFVKGLKLIIPVYPWFWQ